MSNPHNPNSDIIVPLYAKNIRKQDECRIPGCELRKNQMIALEKKISSCKLDDQFNPHHHNIILETMTNKFFFGKKI
ncbi:hypothetical protein APICC_04273 [Apis cerana cerana]|uniref:Uncharacterized protein n=1 Tax=Apis cerana cerana TaxID=94128 RepID=A0A2A3E5V9_APICC|nr:hypothetical protein APICC_04273 [Apis cerana cerana]